MPRLFAMPPFAIPPFAVPLILSMICAAAPAAEIPDKCKPLIDTVDRCQRFDQITLLAGWSPIYEQKFDKNVDLTSMTLLSPQNVQDPEILKQVETDGGALRLDVSNYQAGMLKIGPEVSGEFAIEMRAKTIGGRVSDMSLLTNGLGQGPGFQFGGFANTRNVLWTGLGDRPPAGGVMVVQGGRVGQQPQVEGDKAVLITPQRYYQIRLEVRKDQMIGLIDGKVVAKGPPGNKHDFGKRFQPVVYIFASTVLIDEFRIESRERVVDPKLLEKAWKDAFVHKSRDQAMADIQSLVTMLNDPDWQTRNAASALLARAGTLTIEPLKVAAARGPMEAQERARELLVRLGQPVATDD